MKKTLLAVSITALFATSAQAATVYNADGVSADVYGRMQFDITDNKDNKNKTDGKGSARMGFKGKSAINADLSAIAKGEWQIASENHDDSKFTARHVYAGFESADYGTLIFGQTDTAFYKAVEATDIFETYGYEAFAFIEDGRQEGQVIYSGNFANVYVGASVQFRNEDFAFQIGNPDKPNFFPTDELTGSLDSAYALTLGYNFDFGLNVYAGYHAEQFENADKDNYALSASYTLNDLYLGAAAVRTDLDGDNIDGYDFVAAYTLNKVKLYTGYAVQNACNEILNNSEYKEADAFKLGTSYKFNSNLKTWVEYKLDNADGADDAWTVALQYNF